MERKSILISVLSIVLFSSASTSYCESYWAKIYEGVESPKVFSSIRVTSDGGYVVIGQTESFGEGGQDICVLKLDTNGSIMWQKTYGGSNIDTPYCIQQTSDYGYVVAGYSQSFGVGGNDTWVLRLNNSGEILWQKTYGEINDDCAFYIPYIQRLSATHSLAIASSGVR